jgi:hypothetical protein
VRVAAPGHFKEKINVFEKNMYKTISYELCHITIWEYQYNYAIAYMSKSGHISKIWILFYKRGFTEVQKNHIRATVQNWRCTDRTWNWVLPTAIAFLFNKMAPPCTCPHVMSSDYLSHHSLTTVQDLVISISLIKGETIKLTMFRKLVCYCKHFATLISPGPFILIWKNNDQEQL